MIIPTHIAAGYLLSKTYCDVLGAKCNSQSLFTTVTIIGAVLPDIDVLFGKKVNEHRNTIFHAPLFWLAAVLFLYLTAFILKDYYLLPYIMALNLGIFSHLFLDWFSGRTIGIRVFYPFSQRMYSLFPLHPQIGDISFFPSRKNKGKYIRWLKFYFNNTFLVASEIIILLIFLFVFIFKK